MNSLSMLSAPKGDKFSEPDRTYLPVWKKLKADKKVVLSIVDPMFLFGIKRMISKEKDMDVGFKIINEHCKPRLRFSWNEKKKELTVQLYTKFDLIEIKGG